MNQRKTLTLQHERYTVTIDDASPFDPSPLPALPSADRIYMLGNAPFPTSQHHVTCHTVGAASAMCLLRAGRGPTTVHSHSSVLYDTRCLVAVGSFLVALRLPDLALLWATEVDPATCFGVYHSVKHASYIVHGELEIASVTYDGTIRWNCGGRDIFTNGLTLCEDHIDVVDFSQGRYRIDIATGQATLLS